MSARPNIVVIVLDDTGFAQLQCFGSDMATPAMNRLAAGGLRYNRFHVTALCSPTRACLLTGRNHHAVGMGMVPEYRTDLPGYSGSIPKSAGALPRVLRDAGYSTLAVGKWHLVPFGERTQAGPFDHWPIGTGFERYYGFITAAEDQWTPRLQVDNTYVDPPRTPAEGYHVSEDLADRAIRMVREQQQGAPDRPFLLYLAFGATHQPHQAPPSYIDAYRGAFDGGWDEWRAATFARQLDTGIVPPTTELPAKPAWLRSWDACSADERRLYARMQEVYGGFLTHVDAQIGRVIDHLDATDLLDDTVVMLLSDNGASAEAGPHGSFNYHRHFDAAGEDVESMLAHYDELGGHRSFGHYPWEWAWAGNTPFRLWKRYTWLGGTRVPLVVHWPNGIAARGEIRSQFCHAVDLMPTVLDLCGVPLPDEIDGIPQQPVDGASLQATFHDAAAPAPRDSQYFEVFGSRAIVHGRWKATTDHVTDVGLDRRVMDGSADFAEDRWCLFDLEQDHAEARDVHDEHPEIAQQLAELWQAEAVRNNVLPLMDSLAEVRRRAMDRAPRTVTLRPGSGIVLSDVVPPLHDGFVLVAEIAPAEPPLDGVIVEIGDWHSGLVLYAASNRLTLGLSHLGEVETCSADLDIPAGTQTLGCAYRPTPAGGTLELHHDGATVGTLVLDHPLARVSLNRQQLTVGCAWGFPVTPAYEPPFAWTGLIVRVRIDTDPANLDATATELRSTLQTD